MAEKKEIAESSTYTLWFADNSECAYIAKQASRIDIFLLYETDSFLY